MNLLDNVKITIAKAAQTTATSAINSDAIDMSGWDGVLFIMAMHTANAGNFVNAAQSTTSGGTYTDLAGTKIVPGDNGDAAKLDIFRPQERYVRLEVDRSGATTATGEIYAIQYRGRKTPITNDDAESHQSPAEGTA